MAKRSLALLLVVSSSMFSAIERNQKVSDKPATLTAKEEAALRNAVYAHDLQSAFPHEGRWAFYTILILPNAIESLKGPKQVAALSVLLQIVKGGRAEDALTAGGYAYALAGNPVTGFATCMSPKEGFDDSNNAGRETPREELIQEVHRILKEKK